MTSKTPATTPPVPTRVTASVLCESMGAGEQLGPEPRAGASTQEILADVVAIGESNVEHLEAELRAAKAARAEAEAAYADARRVLGERFDRLARAVAAARAAALDALDAAYAEQEQRLTFDITAGKAHRDGQLAAVRQARETAESLAAGEPLRRSAGISASAQDLAEEGRERLARIRAALEVPVRHIRGVCVHAGPAAPFDAVADAIARLAAGAGAEPAAEPADEPPRAPVILGSCGARSRPQSPAPMALALSPRSGSGLGSSGSGSLAYRRAERRFLVLSAATEKRALDVCSKVRGAVGRCYVDNYRANETLVSAEDLAAYDAVLVWVGGCTGFAGGASFGAVLARYVAAGGGVVVCPWSLATDDEGEGLRGDLVESGVLGTHLGECISGTRLTWGRPPTAAAAAAAAAASAHPRAAGPYFARTGVYHPHPVAHQDEQQDQQEEQHDDDLEWECEGDEKEEDDDAVVDGDGYERSTHPVMEGVRFIDGGDYSGHHSVSIVQDSEGVVECAAMWSDGTPLVLVNRSAGDDDGAGARYHTAVVNLYPVSSDYSVRCWDTRSDFATLLANALHLVSRPSSH